VRVALGPFDVWAPIGRGGTGVVFRGTHRDTGLLVAIKVLHGPQHHPATSGRDPFRNEVQAVAALDHPGVIWVFDAGVVSAEAAEQSRRRLSEGAPWLAMEHAGGGTLAQWEPGGWEDVQGLLSQLLAALGHAHARHVIHRDLKPSNVLLGTAEDARPGWKVTDFGLAAALGQTAEQSVVSGIAGTAAYMAPEQIRAEWRAFGPWTDLYALGCVLHQVVGTGRLFDTDREPALLAAHLTCPAPALQPRFATPPGFVAWVATLLNKEPRDRFQSAAEAARALAALGSALSPAPSSGVPADWRAASSPWPSPRLASAGMGLFGTRTPPIVGREAERDRLWAALRRASRGVGAQAVVIRGTSGVGKSRLARWVGEAAHALAGLPVLHGEAQRGEPLGDALSRPFRRWFHTHRLNRVDRVDRLRRVLQSDDEEWLDTLSVVLGEQDQRAAARVDAESSHLALSRVLDHLSEPLRPAVLVLDSAHASLDVLRFAGRMVQRRPTDAPPILLVVVLSDVALAEDPAAATAAARIEGEQVVLGPLPPPVQVRLIQAILPLERALAAQLAERTAGNPLHAFQVLQSWVEAGVLVGGEGGHELTRPFPGVAPLDEIWPDRVARLLEGLPAESRSALERAAVLGSRVDEQEWQQVCDDPDGTFAGLGRKVLRPERARARAAVLSRLLAARLAVETLDGWSWTHEMLREAVLRLTAAGGRLASTHRAVARTLLHRTDSRRHAQRIGRHLLSGDRPEQAVPQLFLGIRLRLRRLGDAAVLPLFGPLEEALRRATVPTDELQWAEAAALRAEVYGRLGRSADARRWAHRVVELGEAGGWPQLVGRGMVVAARVRLDAGDPVGADAELQRVEELLPRVPELAGPVYAARSRCARHLRDPARSRGYAVLAAQALTDAGDRVGLAEACAVLGEDALADRRLEDAEHFLERAQSVYGQRSPVAAARVGALLGRTAEARGDLEVAKQRLRTASETLARAGSGEAGAAQVALARVLLTLADWAGARAAAAGALGSLGFEPDSREVHGALAILAAAAAAEADWVGLDRHLDRLTGVAAGQVDADSQAADALRSAQGWASAAGKRARADRLAALVSAP